MAPPFGRGRDLGTSAQNTWWQRLFVRGHRRTYFDARRAGDTARDNRDWANAAKHYREALCYDPSATDIVVQLGHALKEMGQLDEAGLQYARALTATPNDHDLHLQCGHFEKVRGNIMGAEYYYRKALLLDPENDDARRELGALLDHGRGRSESSTPPAKIDSGTSRDHAPPVARVSPSSSSEDSHEDDIHRAPIETFATPENFDMHELPDCEAGLDVPVIIGQWNEGYALCPRPIEVRGRDPSSATLEFEARAQVLARALGTSLWS